jgi:hypothetical protein
LVGDASVLGGVDLDDLVDALPPSGREIIARRAASRSDSVASVRRYTERSERFWRETAVRRRSTASLRTSQESGCALGPTDAMAAYHWYHASAATITASLAFWTRCVPSFTASR